MPPIELIAHRGTGKGWQQSQSAPENTLPALRAAWAAGLSACELDIRRTRDGHLLVIHDETTGRTADQDLVVQDHDLATLQGLDAGGWKGPQWVGTRLPTLAAVLDALPEDGRLYIEIKTGPQGVVAPLAEAIRRSGIAASRLAVISFVWETVCAVRAALPGLACYLLVEFTWDPVRLQWDAAWCSSGPDGQVQPARQRPADLDALVEKVREAGLTGLDVSADQPPSFGDKMRAAAMPWVAWTISDPRVALEMAHRGAAGLTTDQPDLVRAALHRSGFQTR